MYWEENRIRMKKRVLICGCNGQLGRTLQDLVSDYPEFSFYCTDIDTLDLRDFDAVSSFINEHKIDITINASAYTAVERAETEIALAYQVNEKAVDNLARATYGRGGFLVHISTDYVFDGESKEAYKPEDTPNPVSVYGASKLAGEERMIESGCRGIIIRIAWLYSIYGNNFVKTMLKLSSEREEIRVVNDQWGAPTNARDLAEVIMKIISYEDNILGTKIYHYSNEGVISWYQFAEEIIRLSGHKCSVCPISSEEFGAKVKRPSFSLLDHTKIAKDFNISIQKWEDSLLRDLSKIKY